KRAFAWACAAGALGPDEDEPGVEEATIDPRVFCTAMERLGNDGSGTTSASTVTSCMPRGCTCKARELSLGLTEMMMSGCFSPGRKRFRFFRGSEGPIASVCCVVEPSTLQVTRTLPRP